MKITYKSANPNPGNSQEYPMEKKSSFDGNDLTALEAQINEARLQYQKYVKEYNDGMAYGDSGYAKRVRLPRVTAAKEVLDQLLKTHETMLASIGKVQNIQMTGQVSDNYNTDAPAEIPWGIIGLAVGALVAIIIIVKLI